MGEEWVPVNRLTGLAIREYLLQFGRGYPYDFYRRFAKVKPTTSYESVRRYFYILKRLGLIERVGTEEGKGVWSRSLYRIVPGAEDDERWFHPQVELYPATRLGSRRYRMAGGGGEG